MERLVDYDKFIKDYGVLSNHEDDYRLLCAANITAYTKDEVIAMLEEIKDEIASNYLIDADTGKIISGMLTNFKAQKLLDRINNKIDKLREGEL